MPVICNECAAVMDIYIYGPGHSRGLQARFRIIFRCLCEPLCRYRISSVIFGLFFRKKNLILAKNYLVKLKNAA